MEGRRIRSLVFLNEINLPMLICEVGDFLEALADLSVDERGGADGSESVDSSKV